MCVCLCVFVEKLFTTHRVQRERKTASKLIITAAELIKPKRFWLEKSPYK
jgi:hypothetical protein